MYIGIYVYIGRCMFEDVLTYAYMHICMYVYICIFIYIHMYVSLSECM